MVVPTNFVPLSWKWHRADQSCEGTITHLICTVWVRYNVPNLVVNICWCVKPTGTQLPICWDQWQLRLWLMRCHSSFPCSGFIRWVTKDLMSHGQVWNLLLIQQNLIMRNSIRPFSLIYVQNVLSWRETGMTGFNCWCWWQRRQNKYRLYVFGHSVRGPLSIMKDGCVGTELLVRLVDYTNWLRHCFSVAGITAQEK